jgi:hypothetical protein
MFLYLYSLKEEKTIKYSELNVNTYFRSLVYHEYGLVFVTVFPNYFKFAETSNSLAAVNYMPSAVWPRGLKHEMSSPMKGLASWVRFLLEALFLLSCVSSGVASG